MPLHAFVVVAALGGSLLLSTAATGQTQNDFRESAVWQTLTPEEQRILDQRPRMPSNTSQMSSIEYQRLANEAGQYQQLVERIETQQRQEAIRAETQTPTDSSPVVRSTQGQHQGVHNIRNTADDGQKRSTEASGANAMMGAGLQAAGMALMASPKTVPKGAIMLAMAALSFAQAASQGGNARDYASALKAADYRAPDLSGVLPIDSGSGDGGGAASSLGIGNTAEADAYIAKAERGLRQLAEMGYKVNLDRRTVTLPDGKEVPIEAFESAEQLAAQGFDGGAAEGAFDQASSLQEKLMKESENLSSSGNMITSSDIEAGGGGGGSGTSSANSYDSGSQLNFSKLLAGLNKPVQRGPANVAGMQRDYNGTLIGVSADDLFQMVHRQYQRQRQFHDFLE